MYGFVHIIGFYIHGTRGFVHQIYINHRIGLEALLNLKSPKYWGMFTKHLLSMSNTVEIAFLFRDRDRQLPVFSNAVTLVSIGFLKRPTSLGVLKSP